MITAQAKRTEVAYRALPVDSSSTIKEFVVDPKKYYMKYVVGEPVEEEDSKSLMLGSLVHCLLLEPELFDSKYFASTCASKPTEKMLEFTEELYNQTIAHTTEEGVLDADFGTLSQLAYNKVGFTWKLDTVLNKWREGTGEAYYDEILKVRPKGLTVVTDYDMKLAEGIVDTMLNDEFVGPILRIESSDDIEVFRELQLEGPEYIIWGLLVKGMIDQLIVDHNKKEITPDDLKITWEPRNFYKGYYLYRRAYIQASVYYKLVAIWAKLNGYEDYHIHYPNFIVGDSANFYKPLIFRLTAQDIADADDGFVVGSTYYKGLHEAITDLKWARDSGEWKMGREDYINKGIVTFL